jgi:RimJ/RimL family protein N-acetyltransferase
MKMLLAKNLDKVLETERLVLRPMLKQDAELVVEWRNAPHVQNMSLLNTARTLTLAEHLAWFEASRSKRIDYIICEKSLGPIGSISFCERILAGYGVSAESGKYIGDSRALGKGYATEATAVWLDFGFSALGLDTVIARTRSTNMANIKINQKFGFSVEEFPQEILPQEPAKWIFMQLKKEESLRYLAVSANSRGATEGLIENR